MGKSAYIFFGRAGENAALIGDASSPPTSSFWCADDSVIERGFPSNNNNWSCSSVQCSYSICKHHKTRRRSMEVKAISTTMKVSKGTVPCQNWAEKWGREMMEDLYQDLRQPDSWDIFILYIVFIFRLWDFILQFIYPGKCVARLEMKLWVKSASSFFEEPMLSAGRRG